MVTIFHLSCSQGPGDDSTATASTRLVDVHGGGVEDMFNFD